MQKPPISLRGVRQNNLKNVDLDIPLGKLTVITGVSGSGKSSLAFDTLYAEGTRRYMESLSTYARQFLEKMPRPDVDAIHNVPPAIALEQRNSITNNRTTLATMTEIYDYLRLFYSSVGYQSCKACGHTEVKINDAESIAERILALPNGTRLYILAKLPKPQEEKKKKATVSSFTGQELFRSGFQRLLVNNEVIDLATAEGQIFLPDDEEAFVLLDRVAVGDSLKEDRSRLLDSIEQALLHGSGTLEARSPDKKIRIRASQGYACAECGEPHTPPTASLFSSNSPLGACVRCSGFGEVLELDEELIVPDRAKSLRDGAVDPLSKPSYSDWEKEMLKAMTKIGVSPGTRYKELKAAEKKYLWDGSADFPGINGYFELLKPSKYKLHVRVFIRRYQSLRICPDCNGSRLTEAPLRFTAGLGKSKKNIAAILDFTVEEAIAWFRNLQLSPTDKQKVKEVYRQICERLEFLRLVGVPYLKLNRKANTLSGGEYQRISLASQLGSKLSNTLYVLDEPSIGLHPHDTDKLIQVMRNLRDHGNTLVVVEHDTSVMRAADFLVEVGPQAGIEGGKIIAQGPRDEFLKNRASLTARYLSGELSLPKPKERRLGNGKKLTLTGAKEHNLKNVNLELPLGTLIAITGVSGSGKSTLIHDTLYKSLARLLLKEAIPSHEIGKFSKLQGWENLHHLLLLDQTPIGRSTRSNTATYIKMYDDIRRIMANQAQAARRSLSPTDFSFNVDGGRCATCKGDGYVEVDMHFMADVRLLCEDCEGKRFKKHVLDVQYKGKNIDDILHTTVKEAVSYFAETPVIVEKCRLLEDVGLGYLQLGQSVSSLSGGECQRLKIASTLDEQKSSNKTLPTLYLFDEPTTGLHLHDIKKLMEVFHKLVEKGHTVLFIEHNMELVSQADWVVDLGPGGGSAGGQILAQGTPEELSKVEASLTAKYLLPFLLLLFCFLPHIHAEATTFSPIELTEQISHTTYIAEGIIRGEIHVEREPKSQLPYTYYHFTMIRQDKGPPLPTSFQIRSPGGEIGETGYTMSGAASFTDQETAIVFLKDSDEKNIKEVSGLSSGKYTILSDEKGRKYLRSGLGLNVYQGDGTPLSPESFHALAQRVQAGKITDADKTIVINKSPAREENPIAFVKNQENLAKDPQKILQTEGNSTDKPLNAGDSKTSLPGFILAGFAALILGGLAYFRIKKK